MRKITHTLTTVEQEFLHRACNEPPLSTSNSDDQLSIIRAASGVAQTAKTSLPELSEVIRKLRNEHASTGLVILQSLPKVDNPRSLIAIVGGILGAVTKYEGEGDYIIEIKEQQTTAGERPSFKNSREFYFHTDLSYAVHPPRFLLMHAVVNEPGEGGVSLFCDIEEALAQLSALDIEELQKPQFLFPAPAHYKGQKEVQFPILTQSANTGNWVLRFRRDNLRSLSRSGIAAITQLIKAIDETAEETMLTTDSFVLVDNHTHLHGRTAFAGGTNATKEPRHLNRIYVEL